MVKEYAKESVEGVDEEGDEVGAAKDNRVARC